jgi:hypothetical protein
MTWRSSNRALVAAVVIKEAILVAWCSYYWFRFSFRHFVFSFLTSIVIVAVLSVPNHPIQTKDEERHHVVPHHYFV